MTERRFVLTKVAAGDYLLPDNGGLILWRIRRELDTPDDRRESWAVYRWKREIEMGEHADPDNWDEWQHHLTRTTRRAAIDAALGGES